MKSSTSCGVVIPLIVCVFAVATTLARRAIWSLICSGAVAVSLNCIMLLWLNAVSIIVFSAIDDNVESYLRLFALSITPASKMGDISR